MPSPQPEKNRALETIHEVLSAWSKASLNYCLLRNFEFLLNETLPLESLDAVISKLDFPLAKRILLNLGFTERNQQFSLVHKAFFKVMGDLTLVSFDLQVSGVYWNDLRYLCEKVITNRIKNNYFYILAENDYAAMLIAHSILGKRKFKEKYQQHLLKIINKIDLSNLQQRLMNWFGKRSSRSIINHIKNNSFGKINCKLMIGLFLFKKPVRILILLGLFWRWIKQRKNLVHLYPLISFVGPDGAGKTSMVNQLKLFLENHSRKVVSVYVGRGRGNIIPFASWGKRYKIMEKKNSQKLNSSDAPAYSFKKTFIYTLAAPIFAADLYLRYLINILPKRLTRTIVLTDRYCSDILLMENVNFQFKKWVWHLFPKPTLSIILYNEPHILLQRRPGESLNNLSRQLEIFNKFNYSLRQLTTNPQEDQVKVISFVFSYLLKNWK